MSIASWLQTVAHGPPGPAGAAPITEADLDALRRELEAAAVAALAAVGDHLDDDDLPLRLPKGRLAAMERCERHALALHRRGAAPATGAAVLLGTALDLFVTHQLVAGRVLEPTTDLRSMLEVSGDVDSLADLDGLESSSVAPELERLAGAVADAWAGIDPAWAPRTQVRAALVLAEGAVTSSGVVDVELGGPRTGRPGVVVEVKSGEPTAGHPQEVYLYGLLVALRDRVAPAVLARWYPGTAPAAMPVSLGALESAAARLGAAIARWALLCAGDTPDERPGGWCAWCPDRDDCPSARAADDLRGDDLRGDGPDGP